MKKELFLKNIKDVLMENEDYIVENYTDSPQHKLLSVNQKNIKEDSISSIHYWYRHKTSFNNIYYSNIYCDPFTVFKDNIKPIYNIMNKFNIEEKLNFNQIEKITDFYQEISGRFNYFKKIEMIDYYNLNFNDFFSEDKSRIKEKLIGKSYYAGLSKNMNELKNKNFKSSPIKINLCIISIDNNDFELGFLINLPMLSNFKFEGVLALTGSGELKEKLFNDLIKKFNEGFRNHILKIIIKKNKLKGQEKKDLILLSDAELVDLFEITEMKNI